MGVVEPRYRKADALVWIASAQADRFSAGQ
ncbi:hypothetical protein GGQ86_002585 [Xanthobacter flavus]|uniref:Uncharacterized protein n=1 Tax=Xanthobacter flavus TaxID=281 RepID=A0ABU1KHZ7_XANFL|nr:hypothetical protein [Xanthobacter flavus]